MKTSKIILSIVGIALTSITFGQLLSQNGRGILYNTLSYNSDSDHLERHLYEFPERRAYGDQFEAPVPSLFYFEPMEKDIDLEPWMTEPFEISYFEEDLTLEPWMTEPFEISYYEAEPSIEPWMTRPFVLEEELQVEEWMLSSWF